MGIVFRVKRFFDASALMIGVSTLLLLGLVVLLSLRLREGEMQTMFKIGCSRRTIVLLQVGELGFVFLASGVLLAAAVWGTTLVAEGIVESLFMTGG